MRQQLIAEGLELEEVGGSVQVVETAATKGTGLLQLEEALIMQVCLHPPVGSVPIWVQIHSLISRDRIVTGVCVHEWTW